MRPARSNTLPCVAHTTVKSIVIITHPAAVQELLHSQQHAAGAAWDYENRALRLELQSLQDRYKLLRVEDLLSDNEELRAEVVRLHQENLQQSRVLAGEAGGARSQAAAISRALEDITRDRLREAHTAIRAEVLSSMDARTQHMILRHGDLTATVKELNQNAYRIDERYRVIDAQRRHSKIDADIAESMNAMLSRQLVTLRHKLDRECASNAALEEDVGAAEARAAAAEDAAAAAAGGVLCRGGGVEAAGRESRRLRAELARAVLRVRGLEEERDTWRTRARDNARAAGDAQACFAAAYERLVLVGGGGVVQSEASVWCAGAGDGANASAGPGAPAAEAYAEPERGGAPSTELARPAPPPGSEGDPSDERQRSVAEPSSSGGPGASASATTAAAATPLSRLLHSRADAVPAAAALSSGGGYTTQGGGSFSPLGGSGGGGAFATDPLGSSGGGALATLETIGLDIARDPWSQG
ncbi:hypothetical protein FOA52_015239 [Chlamydomonas sp. UWO 241]|nr:hypothetical protein FOA52_015239 [Chlamydomonas sp. UWO 241]